MDFALNDEQKMLIDTVRRFIAEQLKPLEDEIDHRLLVIPAWLEPRLHSLGAWLWRRAANTDARTGWRWLALGGATCREQGSQCQRS